MSYGPLEVIAISFPGNQFKGEIVPALEELIASQTIRVIDLAVVGKNEAGETFALEIAELVDSAGARVLDLVDGTEGIFSDEDFIAFATSLEANSTAALLVFENTWAATFATAVRNANGQVILNERIPRAVVEELEASVA